MIINANHNEVLLLNRSLALATIAGLLRQLTSSLGKPNSAIIAARGQPKNHIPNVV
jgi:hypothetical protein